MHISSETLAFVTRTLKIQMTHTYKGFVLNRSLQENLDFILRRKWIFMMQLNILPVNPVEKLRDLRQRNTKSHIS